MAVTSQPIQPSQPRPIIGFSMNRPIAALLWLAACVTTWQLLAALTPGADWRYQVFGGVALQAVFTALEKPTLRGRPNKVSAIILLIDTLINAGGIYPYALRASATPTAQMMSTAFSLSAQVSPIAAFALSALFGFLLAAAPEAVWRWRD